MPNDLIISICGDVCSECPRFIATKSNDIAELENIAGLWYRLGFRDRILSPENLKCTGCSKDKLCSYNLNSCEHLANKNNCGECDHFPCDKINQAFQKTDKTNEVCKNICSDSEYNGLCRAFLMKRQILTEINENYKRKIKHELSAEGQDNII
jgi:hypothetical protein